MLRLLNSVRPNLRQPFPSSFFLAAEKQQIEDELNADVSVKTAENDKYKKAISAAKNSVGGLTNALTACKNTLESAM